MSVRVAIVGGGPGGLSTAWNLVHGERADELDVTVYTMGWRLGGKGATGRGPNGRIQEHGIHGFAGFYWNSTRMLRDAYVDLYGEDPPPVPPGGLPNSVETALVPNDFSVTASYLDGSFEERPLFMPGNDGWPWKGTDVPDADDVIGTIVSAAYAALFHHELSHSFWRRPLAQRLRARVARLERSHVAKALEEAIEHAAAKDHGAALRRLDDLTGRLLDHSLRGDDAARSQFVTLDFFRTLIKGIVSDGVLHDGFEIDTLDDENYIDWLRRHGIHEATLDTGTPNSPAFICFLFPDGDGSREPRMSAASYLAWVIRGFIGKGAPYMFFRAGTGESIITPIYESARKHGASVEFFHRLRDIELSADGSTVERLVFRRQMRLRPGLAEYDPLVEVDGVVGRVWPSAPDWTQLHPDDVAGVVAGAPRPVGPGLPLDHHADLESYWSRWPGVEDVVLERGRHFDIAVLALPPSTFPYVCPKLAADEGSVLHRAMVGQPTCATVGVQLWLDRSTAELGWDRSLSEPDRYMGAGFPNPYNVMVDFSDLIPLEGWPSDDAPVGLIYMCGPMVDLDDPLAHDFSQHDYPTAQLERAMALTDQYLRTAATWLPKAAGHRPADTLGLHPKYLHVDAATSHERKGQRRLAEQYVKANIDPSERYVMAPAGSVTARPMAWGSGIRNLALAGDWIYTGINVGSFEGAATSGRLAAHAVAGSPHLRDIPGFGLLHGSLDLTDVGPPMIDRLG